MTVRARFAPSPTGFLHLGSARTALFNWAYARRHGGAFVLRIEDTDRERSTAASETALLEALRWLGLDWDEGPHRQSERRQRHQEAIEGLLAAGRAYRCTCSKEDLEARRQAVIEAGGKWTYDGRCRDAGHGPDCGAHVVRLRMPSNALRWNDLVFGPSGQHSREIGDAVLRRSDGSPVFHLAVVVDDHDMRIDTVIRGADHHPNTPLQIAIHHALDFEPPRFAHVPLLVGAGGKKLSKRREDAAMEHFREQGYLPEALLNWLVRMGWSHGDEEIFDRDQIVRLFDLEPVGRAAAQADPAKLQWLNQHYIKALPMKDLLERARPHLEAVVGGPVHETPELERLLDLLRERSKTLCEMADRARFALVEEIAYEEKARAKHLTPASAPLLQALHDGLAVLDAWTDEAVEDVFETVRSAHGELGMGKLAQPVRVAVTGGTASPGIFETLTVLGRARTLRRLSEAVHAARHGG